MYGLLEGESPGLLVEEDQLAGNPVFFCDLLPLSCLVQAALDLYFWGGGEHNHGRHHDVGRLGGHGSHGGGLVQHGAVGEAYIWENVETLEVWRSKA